jgi:CRISPR/Cas system-associated protein endoribonuclease Cas2
LYEDFGNNDILNIPETTDDREAQEKYNRYLLDAPPNPLTFNEFKNALEGISTPKISSLPNDGIMQVAEITQKDIDMMKTPVGQMMDYDTFKTISGNDTLTPEEFQQLKATV